MRIQQIITPENEDGTELQEVRVEVEYTYLPKERQTQEHPGSPEAVEIESITEVFPDGTTGRDFSFICMCAKPWTQKVHNALECACFRAVSEEWLEHRLSQQEQQAE